MVKIVVCIKQVPERDARLRIAPDGKSVDTAGVATEINESDQYALEAGLRLAEKVGGEVVALLLGRTPPRRRSAGHSPWARRGRYT